MKKFKLSYEVRKVAIVEANSAEEAKELEDVAFEDDEITSDIEVFEL